MDENKLFYERLLEQSRLVNKSINQIERELGYPRNALHNYRLGNHPSGERLMALANYFKISPEYLMGKTIVSNKISMNEIFNELTVAQKKELLILSQNWLLNYIDLTE